MELGFRKILKDKIEKGSLRSLLSFENKIDFWSNDYLGFGREEKHITLQSGGGSRLISGNSTKIETVESAIAAHFKSEAALFFNSGYDANVGFFSSVPQRGETVVYDAYIHASIRDGLRLSHAKSHSFRHNDVVDLRNKLKSLVGVTYVAIESIYSMDGDIAPLSAIVSVCKEYGVHLIVDEAHAGGVLGNQGAGLMEELGLESECFARLFTFGKGWGAHGAAYCCSDELRTYLINCARSFIYTTALPEAFYVHVLDNLQSTDWEVKTKQLNENIALFKSLTPKNESDDRSPIQVYSFESKESCFAFSTQLQADGFAVKAILPPTIPEGMQRIRICLHAFNSEEEIRKLAERLRGCDAIL